MKRKVKQTWAVVLTLALVLTSVNLPVTGKKAKAAVTPPAENLKETNAFDKDAKGEKLVSTQTETSHSKTEDGVVKYDGYIQGFTEGQYNADYFKITFKVDAGTATDTKIVTFKPYNEKWGGWDDNIIRLSDAQYDEENSEYVAYMSCKQVRDSLTVNANGGTKLSGINIEFCQSAPTVTLTGLYSCKIVDPNATPSPEELRWEEEQKVVVWKDPENKTGYEHQQMQDLYLSQIVSGLGSNGSNYAYSKVSSKAVYVYLKVTKCSRYSRIKVSGGNLKTGSISSNKELIGVDNTTNVKENEASGKGGLKNNATYIHAGWGTTQGYGSGVGAKGTGIYEFSNTKLSNGSPDDTSAGLRLRRMTTDIEGYICGVRFDGVGSVTISEPDENGNVTVTEGFDTSKVESKEKDDTDIEPKPESEMRADEVIAIGKILKSAKEYKKDDILSETVWTTLQSEIQKAEALVAKEDSLSTEIKAQRITLTNYLKTVEEEVDRTATWHGLKASIDYCKKLKEADYSNKTTFAKLADAITTAETAYANKTDTRINYKTARDALEKVRVALAPNVSTAESNPKDFRILGKKEVVKEMGAGINLGNTMDGGLYTVSETSWQAYKTTKAYIKALHDAGYNTVRIPVTWGEHINDDYTIKEAWISRVQEIVDYCVDQDMYAIINIHHDGAANHDDRGNNTPGCWLDTYQWNIEKVYQKYQGVWTTIANRFKDYDEHLIFESMNEVTDAHKLASGQKNEDDAVLNALNQLFINTVRATGSNNTKRWLAITGRFATTTAITKMPEDTLADKGDVGTTRLMFAVHIYKANSAVRWTYTDLTKWQSSLSDSSKAVSALDKEMPLYVGEYGVRTQAQSGSETGYNNAERALNYESCAAISDMYGAVPIVWDQGTGNYLGVKTETGIFTDWDRPNLKPVYDDVVHATIRGTYEGAGGRNAGTIMRDVYKSYGHASENNNDVSKDPEIDPATDITMSTTSVSMKAGEWTTVTAESNSARDMVIWSTDDDAVATVSRGLIHAKGIGITTIHAKTQLSDVVKDIKVIVGASGKETATAIKTDKPYYEITQGETINIKTTLTPENSKDAVTYISSNTDIATVSSNGKVTGENPGLTYIVVSAASGVSTIVAVKVKKKGASNSVTATLNLMIGSITEKSAPVTITGDGQYTVTYDLAKDLSEEGRKANITKLEKLTSVYLRDTNTLKPVVSGAKIRYDKITVNNTELTLKSPEDLNAMWEKNNVETELTEEGCFKNLLKASGQLDSNDPINAWDGSVVNEVTVDSKNHVASFTGIDNPTKISVTFTIKDMRFFPTKEKTKEAEKLESVTANKIVLDSVGATKEIELTMTPTDSDSEVTFYSTKSSVVAVNNSKVMVDADGKIKVTVTGLSEGTVTLAGITENGLKVFYTIGVGDMTADDLVEPVDPTPEGLDGSLWEEPEPSVKPTASASSKPTASASSKPTASASSKPTASASSKPTASASSKPTASASSKPTGKPESSSNPPSGTAKPSGSSAPTKAPAVKPPAKKGAKVVTGKLVYKVTKPATTKTSGTLTVAALSNAGKKAGSLSIPATATINGYKYKVTKLGNNVFKGVKAKSIALGKNITAIPKGAFVNCKKLSTLTVKGKLKSVKKGAFKGCKKKIKLKGGNKKTKKANMKALKKSGYKKFK